MRVVEKYYSARDLAALIGFEPRYWRDRIKRGDLVRAVDISGEVFVPASSVNEFLARHEVVSPGVTACNVAELRRQVDAMAA